MGHRLVPTCHHDHVTIPGEAAPLESIVLMGDPRVTGIPVSDTGTRFTVNNSAGTAATTKAAYVLISFGPDGFGAYPRSGGATRIDTLSTNTYQKNNCDCQDSSGSIATTAFDGVFVQKPATQDSTTPNHTNDFDDIVVYATRQELASPTE